MSAFLSSLWLLGISNSNPSVSLEANNMLNGVIGPALAYPVSFSAPWPQAAHPVSTFNFGTQAGLAALINATLPKTAEATVFTNIGLRLALSVLAGSNSKSSALPVTGVTNG